MTVLLEPIPPLLQGEGALAAIGEHATRLAGAGQAVLLVADPGLRASGLIDEAVSALAKAGLTPVLFDDIKSDPSDRQVDAGAALARTSAAKAVVALGGGSAMDAGKLIAAIAPASAPAIAYALCARPLPASPLPKICVPTTAGTGSETTRVSVIGDAQGAKQWYWGNDLRADLVVLDPVATVGLPAHLTAATGIDALVHAMEAATNRNASAANDVYAHAAIRLAVKHLEAAVAEPRNLTARAGMQLAAAYAGVAIDNAGTAIGHNIGHALGSLRPIHHGRAVGVAMMATLAWNVEGDDGAFAGVAEAMGLGGDPSRVPVEFERLMRATGVKVSLAAECAGITAEMLAAQMARPENEAMKRSNRKAPSEADMLRFAETVLSQA
ncbi:iron-containing alcohol dehydrogenase [uncultured Alsobacter sp.]|uniref:iron-containing alcohol dehydrogenase n=1 Tax=uncultured Alsobacter sp. TaxID=1748258 RepID=UPI0025EAFA35|nr:iron-containing alcohol dehydrogenase [uncultured Alsobacter sp.]